MQNSSPATCFPAAHTAPRMLVPTGKPMVLVRREIAHTAEELRSAEEQRICDMATD